MIEVILAAIGSTEPRPFSGFCRALGDHCPDQGDTAGWRGVFQALRNAESLGLIIVRRDGKDIESLRLTEAGADRIRTKLDERRGLLNYLNQSGGK